jgi:hypothetical protein
LNVYPFNAGFYAGSCGARIYAFVLLAIFATTAPAVTERSSSQRAAFVRQNPCPATGEARGKCPGWVVDHIVPLCADGPDHPSNMQWQDVESAKAKDSNERQQCRALKSRPQASG